MDSHVDSSPAAQAQAWDKAIILLRQSGMSDRAARIFFGRVLKHNKLRAADLAGVLEGAKRAGTHDAQSYIWKGAERVAQERVDPGAGVD
jgi:hypothetical protein